MSDAAKALQERYLDVLERQQKVYDAALGEAQQRTSFTPEGAYVSALDGSPWLSEHEVREAYLRGEIDAEALEAGIAQLLEQGRMPAFAD